MAEFPEFKLGTTVHIDGCASVAATVTALLLRQNGWQAEVSWWNNGELREAWVTVDRLSEEM